MRFAGVKIFFEIKIIQNICFPSSSSVNNYFHPAVLILGPPFGQELRENSVPNLKFEQEKAGALPPFYRTSFCMDPRARALTLTVTLVPTTRFMPSGRKLRCNPVYINFRGLQKHRGRRLEPCNKIPQRGSTYSTAKEYRVVWFGMRYA